MIIFSTCFRIFLIKSRENGFTLLFHLNAFPMSVFRSSACSGASDLKTWHRWRWRPASSLPPSSLARKAERRAEGSQVA